MLTPQGPSHRCRDDTTQATSTIWSFIARSGQEPTAESHSIVSPSAAWTATTRTGSLAHTSHPDCSLLSSSTYLFASAPFTQLCLRQIFVPRLILSLPLLVLQAGSLYSCRKIGPAPGANALATPAGAKAGTSDCGKLTASFSSSASWCQLKIAVKLQETSN